MGVAHLLEGSVPKERQRVRITAELIKAEDGFQVWSQTFDRKMEDIFKVEDEIGMAVSAALPPSVLGLRPGASVRIRNTNPEAHDIYLYGPPGHR